MYAADFPKRAHGPWCKKTLCQVGRAPPLLTVHKRVRQPATLPAVPLGRNDSKLPLLNDNKCQAVTLTHAARIHQTSHHLPGTRLSGGERVLQAEPTNFLHTRAPPNGCGHPLRQNKTTRASKPADPVR